MKLVRSFAHAVHGMTRSLRTERNLRIHLAAACYAVWTGFLAELDGLSWAAVLLSCGAVFAAELFNAALESLCDALCPQRNEKIGAAKDAAAGAVLVLALTSVAVAGAVFGPWVLAGGLLAGWEIWLPPLLSIPVAVLFIGKNIKEK